MNLKAIILVLSLVLIASRSGYAETYRLVTASFAPFTSQDSATGGFLVELTREALKIREHDLEIDFKPWARALKEAANGRYDGLLSAFYNEERAKIFHFSAPLNTTKMVFAAHKDKVLFDTYSNFDQLKSYRLATGLKWAYSNEFENYTGFNKQTVKNEPTGIKLLYHDRIDIFAVNADQLKYNLLNMPEYDPNNIKILSPAISQNDQHIASTIQSEGSLKFLSEFNTGLAAIKANGTYEKIYNRHFKVDEK
ncbi:substrate-binding periplasmic protein [Curvivirga aplysinae]|uniref:substrate-binding periplasmic protein n=1 Tax=Curvivirga aplysinae TaxID=2529852 RepID=UPI0012BC0E52|nr:transporter substrate-binding domain-containing protein [Curvivirga aplysinae]MTI09832.1 transporter substrate-binding domain-containing protein [Curvivirga aplysinae]